MTNALLYLSIDYNNKKGLQFCQQAVNFLLENSLGGGGIASLRPDPLGKSFAQMLLSFPLHNMPDLEEIKSDQN
jgi:hypothetical protein